MNCNILSIIERDVWDIVHRATCIGMNVLGGKFVYKTKRNPDGTISRYKVRLVAQGFNQREGVDYDETYASTTYMYHDVDCSFGI